jgi:ribosomal protein L17
MKKTVIISNYNCLLSNNNTKIYDTNKIKNKDIKEMVENIIKIRKEHNFLVTRTKGSYIREIKAHKRMYFLGLFKSHTQDTDLEEPIRKIINFIYIILGL